MLDVAIVTAYLFCTAAWGFLQARKVRTGSDFTGAAKRQSAFLVFASLTASFLGGGFSFGLASRAFSCGVGHVLTLWGFSVGTVVVGLVVAPRLQRFHGCASVGSLMGAAYGPAARAAVGTLAALFCCAVLGAQLRALGLLLNAWLGLDYRIGAVVGCAVLTALCAGGGSGAVVSAAPVQFLLLLTGFALMLIFGANRAGGFASLAASLPADRLEPFSALSPLMAIGGFLLFMTGETLAPPYVQRLLTGRDSAAARAGGVAAGLFSIVLFSLCGAIGLAAYAFFPTINPELALPTLMSSVLPSGLKGLAAAGILAGLTASGAAFLNAAVANLSCDVLPPFFPQKTGQSTLRMARASAVLFGILASAVAVFSTGVLDALGLAYRLWAPAVAAPLVAAAYGRRSGPMAFWAPALAGILGMLFWELALGNPLYIPSAVFGIIVSGVASFLCPVSQTLQKDGKHSSHM